MEDKPKEDITNIKVGKKEACPNCGEDRMVCLSHMQYSVLCLSCHHSYIS